ncbi:hypothetical protein D1841_11895 [Neglecta sp. X4]|nr:hypothetical protein [Neglectibacter sp. 59]NBJ73964.1 hypothetical protein [Neglectibacter sp. X4]NCE81803.1 hypothetical protein [Neglectibacter sp. X58]
MGKSKAAGENGSILFVVFYFAYRACLKIEEVPDFRLRGFLTQKSSHIGHKGGISDFSNKPMAAGVCCKKGFM